MLENLNALIFGYFVQEEPHVIVQVMDGVAAAVVFRVIRHTSAMAMSGAAPRTVASFARSTGESFHTRTPPCHTIAFATIGALHNAVCDVGGRCRVAPRKPGGAHALRAIAPTPTSPAITPSHHHYKWAERGLLQAVYISVTEIGARGPGVQVCTAASDLCIDYTTSCVYLESG